MSEPQNLPSLLSIWTAL